MLATDVIEAERIIENLFYSGERQPHMWWDRFERELKEAYAIVDPNAGRNVHEDDAKLRKLVNHRVTADFLKGAKDVLLVEMGKPNAGGMTFDMAMATFRNAVNAEIAKKPSGVSGGRGRRGQTFRVTSQAQLNTTKERLEDGTMIDYHPGKHFPKSVLSKFPSELYARMQRERKEYREKMKGNGGKKGRPNARKRQAKVKKLNARISELEAKLTESATAPTGGEAQNFQFVPVLHGER
eukprot:scaffold7803_cov85-Cylindrotheca_fusiformis.AAC.1